MFYQKIITAVAVLGLLLAPMMVVGQTLDPKDQVYPEDVCYDVSFEEEAQMKCKVVFIIGLENWIDAFDSGYLTNDVYWMDFVNSECTRPDVRDWDTVEGRHQLIDCRLKLRRAQYLYIAAQSEPA